MTGPETTPLFPARGQSERRDGDGSARAATMFLTIYLGVIGGGGVLIAQLVHAVGG